MDRHHVVILGLPAVGKTTYLLTNRDKYIGYSLYHTDDYMEHGFEKSLYVMMGDIAKDSNPKKIIEGVQGFRLLRKGLEYRGRVPQILDFSADEVIMLTCNPEQRIARYKARSGGKSPNTNFDKLLYKIWQDYLKALPDDEKHILKTVDVSA